MTLTIADHRTVRQAEIAPVYSAEAKAPLGSARPFRLEPRRRAQDEAIMIGLLTHLKERERDAMLSFYCDGMTEREIEDTLGVSTAHLRELRHSMKASFLEQRAAVS